MRVSLDWLLRELVVVELEMAVRELIVGAFDTDREEIDSAELETPVCVLTVGALDTDRKDVDSAELEIAI